MKASTDTNKGEASKVGWPSSTLLQRLRYSMGLRSTPTVPVQPDIPVDNAVNIPYNEQTLYEQYQEGNLSQEEAQRFIDEVQENPHSEFVVITRKLFNHLIEKAGAKVEGSTELNVPPSTLDALRCPHVDCPRHSQPFTRPVDLKNHMRLKHKSGDNNGNPTR